ERALSGMIAAAEPEIRPSGPPANKSVPKLGSPQSGAILANGRSDRQADYSWEFDWSDCPGATQYHLYVIGQNTQNPVINDETITASSYSKFFRGGYVADQNLKGWTWKVRAKIGGVWGEWSELHSFDVEPMGTATVMMAAPKLTAPAHQIVYDHYP